MSGLIFTRLYIVWVAAIVIMLLLVWAIWLTHEDGKLTVCLCFR